ncbi:hypothetical protein [Salinibacter ruber]|uniref:hypothetical protein n=1 Tax=Salinibacter ruber TaxID=146919 RepID=UPI000E573C3B|nr:hypothetical protein [Salinibacter ruber]
MPQNADEYHVFTDEAHPMQPPTNGRVKDLMRLQLRSPMAGSLPEKKQVARSFGWDPADVLPKYSREETVEEGGEEKTITRDNDLEPLSVTGYFARAAEVVLEGCDTDGREDEVRMDEVRRAIEDFTERGIGTNDGSMT